MYLLCRPLGGLNDCLCQVEYCRKLAVKSKRTLVVQTMSGNPELTHRFDNDFYNLFEFDKSVNQIPFDKFRNDILPTDTTYPHFYNPMQKNIDYPLQMFHEFDSFKLASKNLKSKKENHVVHECDGGGLTSANLLTLLKLKKHLFDPLTSLNLSDLNVGLHFRSSDYVTSFSNLEKAVLSIDPNFKVYICSDNKQVFNYLQERFPNRKFIRLSNCVQDSILRNMSNVEQALLDLLIVSMCKELLVLPLQQTNNQTPKFSGFTRLAKHIWAVNTVNQNGVTFWIRRTAPFRGLSGSRNIFFSAFYTVFYEIPRVINQGKKSRGVYKQLSELMTQKKRTF